MSSRAEITGRKQETGRTERTQNLYLSSLCAQETLGAQGFCFCQGEGREFESRHPLEAGFSRPARKHGGVAERPKAAACKAVKPRVQIPSPPQKKQTSSFVTDSV